ncbi:MAG: Uma2 family endonuclease [Rhodothermales bacterium]
MQTAEALSDYERERGKPMPSKNHSFVQFRLVVALSRYSADYSILPELSLELDGRTLVPDISVFHKDAPDWRHDEIRVEEAPLLAIEILSPRQAMQDLAEKFEAYFAAGVKACWLVQPMLKTIAVFAPESDVRVHTEGVVKDPETGIEVALEEIFG